MPPAGGPRGLESEVDAPEGAEAAMQALELEARDVSFLGSLEVDSQPDDKDEEQKGDRKGGKGKAKAKAKAKAKEKASPGGTSSQSQAQAAADRVLRGQPVEESDLGSVVQYWNKQLFAEQAKRIAMVRAVRIAKLTRLELKGQLRNHALRAVEVHAPRAPCW